MDRCKRIAGVPALLPVVFALILLTAGCSQGTAPPPGSPSAAESAAPTDTDTAETPAAAKARIPSYHESAEAARPLPTLRPASRYEKFPVIERAYTIAAEITEVLAQQPCYCYCDTSSGHGSLADCWASDHGAGWKVCLQEVLLAGQLHKQGKSPEQIREAIIRGDWKGIVLD